MTAFVTRTLGVVAVIAPFLLSAPISAQQPREPSLNAFPNYQFGDTQDHWAWACIEGVGEEGLMKGYLDGRFQPDDTMTRAEFAAVMVKAFPSEARIRESPNFSDVAPDFWGKEAIATAYQNGYLAGYPDNVFKPDQPISRAQAIIVIARAQSLVTVSNPATLSTGETVEDVLQTYFTDAANIPTYARFYVAEATQRQIVVNYPAVDRLRANESITRGEVTALLCRANVKGADARYYVPAQYVAAFNNGVVASERVEPELLGAFPEQSTGSLFFYSTAAFPGVEADEDYTKIERLFFSADDGRHGEELWVTDGTADGTRLFLDVATGLDETGAPRASAPDFVGFADDRFWFATNQRFTEGELAASIWSSDGTVKGTRAIASLSPSLAQTLSDATSLTAYPNYLFKGRFPFMVGTPSGYQLWLSDGVSESGTQQLADFPQTAGLNASPPYEFSVTPDRLFFQAPSTDGQSLLWQSDGTSEGTNVLDGALSFQTPFKTWKNRIFFTASTESEGLELWTSDGTETGTLLVEDIYPGSKSSLLVVMESLGSSMLALANDAEGLGLWMTGGTSASTRRITLLKEDFVYLSGGLSRAHNNKLYFAVSGFKSLEEESTQQSEQISELWVTDGTVSGTQRLQAFSPNSLQSFVIFKDRLFFSGGGPTGSELWTSDGTAEGTHLVMDLSPGTTTELPPCAAPPPEFEQPEYCAPTVSVNGASPIRLMVRGEFLYFITEGNELFRTDGTGLGMEHIKTLNRGEGDPFNTIASMNTALLFTAYDENTGGLQLWALPD